MELLRSAWLSEKASPFGTIHAGRGCPRSSHKERLEQRYLSWLDCFTLWTL